MLPGVGVFGTSLTARVIIPLLKDEGFAVKALWGRTQEEAEELAKEMSVPFYTSRIDEVLLHQDVDLVCINLPPPLTRQIAVKTLGSFAPPQLPKTLATRTSLPSASASHTRAFLKEVPGWSGPSPAGTAVHRLHLVLASAVLDPWLGPQL
uniref:Gfo/Idh/MocA-like oxidoreductase domain containing 1 n=1 Tax=Lynx canadensis TaxID=61383 RepID=A0A667HRU1_LYNCA